MLFSYLTDNMKLLLLVTLFSCVVLPYVSAGRFICYFANWAIERQGNLRNTFSKIFRSNIHYF